MKTLFKITLLFLFVTLIFTGCANEAQKSVGTDNPNFEVQLLFEVDGAKVYRFCDAGHYHYFTNVKGSVISTETHGKTRVNVEIPTTETK